MSLKGFITKCHQNLISGAGRDVEIALDYLFKRKLISESLVSHKIGFCDKESDIPDSVRFFGSEEQDEPWDISGYLKGRIIVPVFDEFGETVGLASRYPSFKKGNTWWNLPVPFHKGNHLFLLNLARKTIFKTNKVYLVEGYMDALMLYQEGLHNVVGLMGTALTQRKVGLITRYCNEICLCFDVDENESGQKAKMISIALLKKFDLCDKISVIEGMPVGVDPADYVKKYGLQNFLDLERELSEKEMKRIVYKLSMGKRRELLNAK